MSVRSMRITNHRRTGCYGIRCRATMLMKSCDVITLVFFQNFGKCRGDFGDFGGDFGDGEIWHEVRNPRSAPTL